MPPVNGSSPRGIPGETLPERAVPPRTDAAPDADALSTAPLPSSPPPPSGATHAREPDRLQPGALALAILFPGAGHAFLGDVKRGICIGAGVLGLFLGGLLVGGIDVVDRKEDFWWFVAQAGVGPVAFGVDAVHQSLKVPDESRPGVPGAPGASGASGAMRSPYPGEGGSYTKSLGKINEIGALYCALAGLLNVIAVLDAGWRPDRRVHVLRASTASPASEGA